MFDTAPDAGAVAADPYPNFEETILEPTTEAAPATPPAAPDAGAPAPDPSAQPAAPDASAQPPTPGSSAPSPAAPPVPGAPPVADRPAWEFQADRQAIAVPGSKLREDGWLEVPPDQRPLLEQLLAEGVAHRGSWREEQQRYEARIAELTDASTNSPDIVRAKAFNDAILALLDQGSEAVAAWLDDFKVNFPVLKHQAELAVKDQRLKDVEARLTAKDEESEVAELAPALHGMIRDTIQQVIASDPKYAGVDVQTLDQRIRTRFIDQVAYEVEPKDRPRGLQPGEVQLGRSRDGKYIYVFNAGLVQEEVAYQASLRGGAASAAAAAVARNKATAPPAPGAGAPPVVPAGNGQPGTPPGKPFPTTREEMERWIADGSWKQSFPG